MCSLNRTKYISWTFNSSIDYLLLYLLHSMRATQYQSKVTCEIQYCLRTYMYMYTGN